MRSLAVLAILLAASLPAGATGTFDKAGNWIADPPPPSAGAGQAAATPGAEPLDYNKVCEAFGPGFVAVAGGTTCFKIGGYVKVGTSFGHATGHAND